MTRSLFTRAGAVSATAAVILLAVAGPASAHVTVNPGEAAPGAYTKVAFRVPNETDSTDTIKLEINLPTDTPIASVSLEPISGWTAATVSGKLATPIKTDDGEITEAVSKITWTASAAAATKPGQFQEFEVLMGPLPDAKQVIFKALQTYSDGTVVRWIDEPTTDGSEPEHPAPVLKLAAAGAAEVSTAAAGAPAAAEAVAEGSDDGGSGTAFGIAGVALGLAALVLGLLAYRKAAQSQS
ncbi:YcnI family copper-binding membrane protein [Micromonosporaceae bacterium Da 78-11]